MKSSFTATLTNEKHQEQYNFTKNQTFVYCVYPGNYPATMRTVMNKRGNWVEVNFI